MEGNENNIKKYIILIFDLTFSYCLLYVDFAMKRIFLLLVWDFCVNIKKAPTWSVQSFKVKFMLDFVAVIKK